MSLVHKAWSWFWKRRKGKNKDKSPLLSFALYNSSLQSVMEVRQSFGSVGRKYFFTSNK